MKKTLKQLFLNHKGKVSDKWSLYLDEWDRLFLPYRDQKLNLLEIGIQNGGSLEVWSRYFLKAVKIVGCDIDKKCEVLRFDDARIAVIVGDANSDECESEILQQASMFNIIIDDGSHKSSDTVRSFARYFPHLNDSGIYLVEDLHSSYWGSFEGGLYNPLSAMSFFKRLSDILNFEHWRNNKSRRSLLIKFAAEFGIKFDEFDLTKIHSIEFVNSLCLINKLSPEKNVLGKRIIVGTGEDVSIGLFKLNGTAIHDSAMDIEDDAYFDVFEMITQTKSLTQEVAEKDQALQVLSAQMAEIKNSKSWKIALLFRRIRVLLAPPNSRRSQSLRWLINIFIVPFKKFKSNRKLKKDLALIRSSGIFDEDWYLLNNPDVAQAKIDPILHYLRYGGFEGRDPGPYFSSVWYLNTNEDIKKAGINPLVHFLKYRREEGWAAQPAPQFLTSSGIIDMAQNKRSNDLAVVIHIFYEDLFEEIKNYLHNLTHFDLYISIQKSKSGLKDRIFASFPDAKILYIENRGRDILPFIYIYRNISLLNYKYLLKIHTKKSPHLEDGSTWRTDIYRKLLGSSETINSAMLALDSNPAIGIIGPKGHVLDYRFFWENSKRRTEELVKRVGISLKENYSFSFVAGTMFWAKPDALRYLSLLPIDLQEFEFEPLGIDGALVHALERFIGLTIEEAGYLIYEIDDQGIVSDPRKNPSSGLFPVYVEESIKIFGEGNTAQLQNSDNKQCQSSCDGSSDEN
jgi:hypothetical protein